MQVRFKRASRPLPPLQSSTELCDQLNLLAHAQMLELDIGSRCGGHGICGGDRIQVVDGPTSPVTDNERRHLTQDELRAGWRLGCQCFPEVDPSAGQRDVVVELP